MSKASAAEQGAGGHDRSPPPAARAAELALDAAAFALGMAGLDPTKVGDRAEAVAEKARKLRDSIDRAANR